MTALRVAIVGFGKVARDQHVPAIAATDGVTLAAVASRNARLLDVRHFTTLVELLGDGPPIDAVVLCTPPQVRRAQAAAAFSAGKHVMLEKPPGASVSELDPLIALAARAGRTLFASWHSRLAPAVEPARQWLSSRRIRSVHINWKEDVRVWHPRHSWIFEPGGLGVFDPGINALSILTRILPQRLFVAAADLCFPANREAPISARVSLADSADHRRVRFSADRPAELGYRGGDRRRAVDALRRRCSAGRERQGIGRRGGSRISRALSTLCRIDHDRNQRCRPDAAPAFLLGRRRTVEPFED
jgi:D-galactose 1-dehydrogenase